MTAPIARLDVTALDTAEPRRLAEFYAALLGWEIDDEEPEFIVIRGADSPSGPGLAFQLAPDHVPPTWPDNAVPQQSHLDLTVPDLDEGERQVVALGAEVTGLPGGDSSFRVYRDPAGHPFCLCRG